MEALSALLALCAGNSPVPVSWTANMQSYGLLAIVPISGGILKRKYHLTIVYSVTQEPVDAQRTHDAIMTQ